VRRFVALRHPVTDDALSFSIKHVPLDSVLSPSTEAENLYRRLGFKQAGKLTQWHRR
jgi:hypothetical protein